MRKNPRRILSPQRLPFRHPGSGSTNLANAHTLRKTRMPLPSRKSPDLGDPEEL
jgi:hypothetical protein